MRIIVNGADFEIEEGLSIAALLDRLGRSIDHVAVEYNGELIEPSDYATLALKATDRLEVVHFVGGG